MKQAIHVKLVAAGWQVKSAKAKRAVKICETQAEAIQLARRIAMNRGCELIVYRVDGSMRSKDTFGSDPFPLSQKEL
jgi:hypothetical protein